jgi:hypothetical protein
LFPLVLSSYSCVLSPLVSSCLLSSSFVLLRCFACIVLWCLVLFFFVLACLVSSRLVLFSFVSCLILSSSFLWCLLSCVSCLVSCLASRLAFFVCLLSCVSCFDIVLGFELGLGFRVRVRRSLVLPVFVLLFSSPSSHVCFLIYSWICL